MGGVQWGSAADGTNVYVALSDIGRIMLTYSTFTDADPKRGGGMFALRLETGERVWYTPPAGCGDAAALQPGAVGGGQRDPRRRVLRIGRRPHARLFDDRRHGPLGLRHRSAPTRPSTACRRAAARSTARARRSAAAWCSSTPATTRPAACPGNVLLAFSVDGK